MTEAAEATALQVVQMLDRLDGCELGELEINKCVMGQRGKPQWQVVVSVVEGPMRSEEVYVETFQEALAVASAVGGKLNAR